MIKLSFKNLLSSSIVIASGSKQLYPVSNLLLSSPSKLWKTANPYSSSHSLTMSYVSNTVSCFGLFNMVTNVDALITVNIKLGSVIVKTLTFTGEDIVYGYGEGPYGLFAYGGYAAPGRSWLQKFRVIWFEDVISDNLEVIITNAKEFSLGYIHLGGTWNAPTGINADYTSTFTPISTDIVRNIGGVSVGTISRNYRNIQLTLQMLTGIDVTYLIDNHDANVPVIVSAFGGIVSTEASYGTLLAKIPDGITYVGAPHRRFTAANMKLEELK